MASRVNLSGTILCAPAALDLIEVKKAFDRGEKLVSILKKMVADMEKERGEPWLSSASASDRNPDRRADCPAV